MWKDDGNLYFQSRGDNLEWFRNNVCFKRNGDVHFNGKLHVGLPVYTDNATALSHGMTAGAFYHAGDGIVRVVF
ncbi:MAG: hypothetical protein CUR32_01045 [Flavobacterium sp.]|nr:MAG: hypothetical protein CUR32_01045 [Flavobacterium sp.] [Flavobacterium sp. FEMGT703F]